jgi:transposase
MKPVELYARVRYACQVEGLSQRETARRFGIDPKTVRKMLAFSVPPGYRRTKPPARPKLDPFTSIIDRMLEADRSAPPKQRHTAKRIYERLRAEHGFKGSYTTVKDYVRERRARGQEMFVPLLHPPGHAQVDFGEAVAVIGGVRQAIHIFCLDLPHSDAGFVKAYPAERTEAFLDGHVAAFSFLGGVPRSILYDNTKLAVTRILGDGRRERTRSFAELQSHYLFLDRFGRPGKGNDKGKVEGLVGYARRNFLVPLPEVPSFAALNAHLEQRCLARLGDRLRGHTQSIGERLERDLEALQFLPASPYDACDRRPARVSLLSLVRYDRNDYSVPAAYGHRPVLVRGSVEEVVIACGAEIIARHPRSYGREDFIFDPRHYLALLEQKIGALDQAAPLQGWELPDEFGTLRRLLEARMGKGGKREYVQVLRLLETFRLEDVQAGVREALRLGALGFDAVKHLVLCRIERRPPKLDLTVYPYLPRVAVATTSARTYMALLGGSHP